MKQLSLVSLYGQKSNAVKDLVLPIWKEIEKSSLNRVFDQYALNQIHSTIIGMEKVIGYEKPYNANHWEKGGGKSRMKFKKLYDHIKSHFPLNIQFGGFDKYNTDFISFDRFPYERSFQINFATKKVILIGWPVQKDKKTVNSKLLKIRDDLFAKNNIRHKYDGDNDFYLVIGELQNLHLLKEKELIQVKKEAKQLEHKIRSKILKKAQLLTIKKKNLFYVQYQKETLELASSNAFNFKEVKNNTAKLEDLYF